MPRDVENDLKKIKNEFVSTVSKIVASDSKSQGQISVYEIDIVGYGKSTSENSEIRLSRVEKKKKRKSESNETDFTIGNKTSLSTDKGQTRDELPQNLLAESHYPVVEEVTNPDLNTLAFEIHLGKNPTINERQKCTWKLKSGPKKSPSSDTKVTQTQSLSEETLTDSDEKFKSQMRKQIIEDFLAKDDFKIKNMIQSLKKLENGSVHLHHHEHHHHYYFSPSKGRDIKNLLSKIASSETKTVSNDSKHKRQPERDRKDQCDVNSPETTTFVCQNQSHLSEQKSNPPNLKEVSAEPIKQKHSPNLHLSSSIDSFLGAKSDLIATKTFSQADLSQCFSKSGSDEATQVQEVYKKKSYVDPEPKEIPEMRSKKSVKPDNVELMESLRVLDKYLEQKLITPTKTKISYVKCKCPSEDEKMEETEMQSTVDDPYRSGVETSFTDYAEKPTNSGKAISIHQVFYPDTDFEDSITNTE